MNLPKNTPFSVPDEVLARQEKAILHATTLHPLEGTTVKAVPFMVPQSFWEQQYGQILDRKASPGSYVRWVPVLRPALACTVGLCLLFAVGLQPEKEISVTTTSTILVSEALHNSSGTDAQLLLEDQPETSDAPTGTALFDDEDPIF